MIGELDALAGIEIEQAGEPVKGGLELGAGDDQPLLFILQLHIGAQGIDAGADAVLLQIGGLVVDGLRQIDARLGGLDIGGGALAAEVLRHDQEHALLANRGFLGARNVDPDLAGAIAPPEREVEDGSVEVGAELLIPVGPHVLGEAGEAEADGGFEVDAVDGLAGAGLDLRQERGARETAILGALRDTEIGKNHARILLQRKLDGIAKGELEGRWILGKSAGGERE